MNINKYIPIIMKRLSDYLKIQMGYDQTPSNHYKMMSIFKDPESIFSFSRNHWTDVLIIVKYYPDLLTEDLLLELDYGGYALFRYLAVRDVDKLASLQKYLNTRWFMNIFEGIMLGEVSNIILFTDYIDRLNVFDKQRLRRMIERRNSPVMLRWFDEKYGN